MNSAEKNSKEATVIATYVTKARSHIKSSSSSGRVRAQKETEAWFSILGDMIYAIHT